MEINDKVVKEVSAIGVILLFGILVFFAIQPLLFAVIWGLILGYVFMPIYNWLLKYVKNGYVAAVLTLLLAILLILIPLWFIIPLMVQQIFGVYSSLQALNLGAFISSIFPSASAQFVVQATATLNVVISKLTSSMMTSLIDISLNLPLLFVDIVIVAFVFFFTLKDGDKLKEFVKSISPLSKTKEKMVIKQFKDITYSTIFGRFVVGIVQGLLSGLGFLMFGVDNALLFTMLAVFMAVLPSLGVYLIWIPIAIYMFATGSVALAIAFVLYNLVLVSNIDNFLLAYIISKRTTLSPVIALVSSIGGLFLFGLIGIILGPLIFAYFIILLDLYRNKNLLDLFSKEEPAEPVKSESK
jgi:predicted PurR-regulated permease PerM